LNSDLRQGFYLKDLLVEPAKGNVTGAIRSMHLPPKAMEVLVCLAECAGQLVTRDELIERVWGADCGSQEALNRAIREIRNTLDDQAENPSYVQTVLKDGYRLLVQPVFPSDRSATRSTPAPGMMQSHELGILDNLKQRGVLETALAYLVIGWLIIQVVDVLFDQLHLPDWAGTFVTVGVIAGFPIAIVLSWFLELRHGRAVLDELSPGDVRRPGFSRTYVSVIAALGIAAIIVFIYDRNVGLPEAPKTETAAAKEEIVLPPVQDNSIAVLPFFNMDGSNETQIFSQGLVDDVITRLSRVPGLLVSSRGDAFTLEPNSASQKVRERLRVALYLEGSVQMQGDRMRIIVQLIDSETGFHILSRRFDRLREDFFDIRDEITELTVANVRVALPPDTQAITNISADDPSLDVYVLYRRGMDSLYQAQSIATLETAIGWFTSALDIDPDYAAAHAGKCSAFVKAYPLSPDSAYISHAEDACARALELNPNLDVIHTALGDLYSATGRYPEAENAYLAALDINPNSVNSLSGLSSIYMLENKAEEAEARLRQAIGLHPGDWSAYNALGYFLYRSGRYVEAAENYEVVVALDSTNMLGFTNLGSAYMLAGDFSASATAFRKSIDIEPSELTFSNLGLMYYYLGQFEESINAHSQAIKLSPNAHLAWSNLGDAFWISGKEAQAKDAFRTAEELAKNALQVNPNDPYKLMDLAWITTMLDQRDEAYKLLERARLLTPDDPYLHYYEGLMGLRNGDKDAALSSFALSVDKGYPVTMLAADPQLAPLMGHPELEKIVRQADSR
jgi:tetratricopeptide (TPR) repeat protein/TolB-like protein/DNA-binding winged helix-turn-helix (wHTH) protein